MAGGLSRFGKDERAGGEPGNPCVVVVALALGGLYLGECLLASGIYNDDDIGHYLMARDAPRNPMLYLNVWGRPLFTTGL